jgi:hypothetical protein
MVEGRPLLAQAQIISEEQSRNSCDGSQSPDGFVIFLNPPLSLQATIWNELKFEPWGEKQAVHDDKEGKPIRAEKKPLCF